VRIISLCVLLVASGCATPDTLPPSQASSVRESELRASLGVLAADSLRGRLTGSEGGERAARFIASQLAAYGIAPAYAPAAGPDSSYFQRLPIAAAARAGDDYTLLPSFPALDSLPASRRRTAPNVVGVIAGSDPALREEAIVIAAHYDHVGVGRPVNGDSIYNGADDDASGVVTVLEMARALAQGPPPKRTVVVLLTTGEEVGLLGTRWYIEHPRVPLARTVAELEVEMIGRPDPLVGGAGRAWLTGFPRSTLGERLAAAGLPIGADPHPAQRFFERSDNIAFACRGIPAHTLSSYGLHRDYHTPDDEVERIDFPHMARAVEAGIAAARMLADGARPEWKPGGSPAGDPSICARF
jgi:hypothetical protein